MARVSFRLPDIGEGIAEAEIVTWHVKIGDMVEEDQPIADMMTDKATVEMAAPVSGRIVELAGEVGDQIPIGSTLAVFETQGEAAPSVEAPAELMASSEPASPSIATGQTPQSQTSDLPSETSETLSLAAGSQGSKKVMASPAVRARAKELGVDLTKVLPASGGRVKHSDLDAFLKYAVPNRAAAPVVATGRGTDFSGTDDIEEIKITGLRRRIAENMAQSKRRIPHFAYVEELDVTAVEALRHAMNAERGERAKLTMLPFLITAIVRAVAEFPMVNARYDDDAAVVTRYGAVHLGMATQTDAGLSVPVIRDAQSCDLWQLATEIVRLADATRRGKASRDELSGSTITLTSLGALGGIVSTPVINRPEVAIVGVNRMVERPVVIDGRIEVRTMMNLSSSFDHRVVDGMDAARFIQAIKKRIEVPALLFAA